MANYKNGKRLQVPLVRGRKVLPQALHLDIDQNYAIPYTEPAAKLWRKGAKNRVHGLQLRIIPCFGSSSTIAFSDNQRVNLRLMAAKQQFFMNSYIIKSDNSHIMNLDAPVTYATDKTATLRKYLMSRSPEASVSDPTNICIC
jgi:hypothetical protein